MFSFSNHPFADRETIQRNTMQLPKEVPAGVDGLSHALFQSCGVHLRPGHRFELVENGRIFEALLQEIEKAERSIHILVFIWRHCDVSKEITAALVRKARAGVKVRVCVDPVGSEDPSGDLDFDTQVDPILTEAGCDVHYYRLPWAGRLTNRMFAREHQKIAIFDGRVAITGGFGIWKSWLGDGLKKDEWRDTHVRIEGPAVQDIQVAFARSWQESGGCFLEPEELEERRVEGSPLRGGYVTSYGRLGITDAERMWRVTMAAARRRLWIANAYFTPPRAILELLEYKAQNGVDVRILGPGPIHDWKLIRNSQRACYERLLRAGVRIWEYQPTMMHAKTLIADDWLAVIGSANLDPLSLNKLGEGALIAVDPQLVGDLSRGWERDLKHSREMTLSNGGGTTPLRWAARRITDLLGHDRY